MDGDRHESWEVMTHTDLGSGRVSTFVEEEVRTPSGEVIARQYITHPGAVGIIAWDEEADTIMCVRQYRHPVRAELLEVPAGLLDVDGEDYVVAAQRELAEEAQLAAERWEVLVDVANSPGASAENLRIFLARGLSTAQRPEGFVLEGEEAHMSAEAVPRGELVEMVLDGRCANPTLVTGVLALEAVRTGGRSPRPADAPWLLRDRA